jgi:hypothetical protein
MDLLKSMVANRHAAPVQHDPKPRAQRGRKAPTKTERAAANTPGSRAMRKFIIDEKPSKKVVKDHLEAILARACESSDDE